MSIPFTAPNGELPAKIETLKNFHQYYRDALSQPAALPGIGNYPLELIQWVIDRSSTDVPQLVEMLDMSGPSGLSPTHDLALRLALFTILQANLASDHNNTHPNYTLPPGIVVNIKRSLSRILELHPTADYIALCVQLLYRIKEIEEVLALSEDYPDIFARYPTLQAIVGFIHTTLGNHERALAQLEPLAQDENHRNLPLVGLSLMTNQYLLGRTPEWPLSFPDFERAAETLPQLIGQLPQLKMVEPLVATPRPVVFVACDSNYFKVHARFLAYSLHATNVGKLDLHLHLYSPDPEVFDEIALLRRRLPGLSIGISTEQGPAPVSHAPAYYATARFVRAYQVLQHYQCELCMMDADALFNGNWDKFIQSLPAGTELALTRSDSSPFWERILAGFAYCRPTPLAEQFLANVSYFILHNIARKKLIWFTDQIALSVSDHRNTGKGSKIYHIDYRVVIDLKHTPDSLCWMVTTKKNGNPEYDKARERLERRYSGI